MVSTGSLHNATVKMKSFSAYIYISLTINENIMNEESKIVVANQPDDKLLQKNPRFEMKTEIIETDQVKERKGTVKTVNILIISPMNNALSYSSERVTRTILTHIVEGKMNELCPYINLRYQYPIIYLATRYARELSTENRESFRTVPAHNNNQS